MGEVYRAKDRSWTGTSRSRYCRKISWRVERAARFEREARVLASLNHPGIAAIYSFEEIPSSSSSSSSSRATYLVMELLEGETLAEPPREGPDSARAAAPDRDPDRRRPRPGAPAGDRPPGPQARQRHAHEERREAARLRARQDPGSAGGPDRPRRRSRPWRRRQHLTQQGTILGTFQYMAPEQLEGSEADARSDIFAFGAVLYEMATGKKGVRGEEPGEPHRLDPARTRRRPLSSIAPMTPPALDRVIATCLAKDPDDRFQTAHDVRLQLQWIAEGGSQAGVPAPVVQRRRSRERLAWTVAAAALVAAAGLARSSSAPPARRSGSSGPRFRLPKGRTSGSSRTARARPSSPRTAGRSRSRPPTRPERSTSTSARSTPARPERSPAPRGRSTPSGRPTAVRSASSRREAEDDRGRRAARR